MTTLQQQYLLAYLGYDPGYFDGIYGTKTGDAIEDFQRDNDLDHDRTWGPKTEEKARQNFDNNIFRAEKGSADSKDAAVDPPAPDPVQPSSGKTGTFWDGIKYLTRHEFRCPCGKCGGFPVEPKEALVRFLDEMRGHFGKVIIVVPPDGHSGGSGVRCAAYNATLSGSVSNSTHLQGRAADFSMPGVATTEIKNYLAQAKATGKIAYWYQITSGSFHVNI